MPSSTPAFHDQSLDDGIRRRQGAFFTPAEWAAQAASALDGALPGWRDDTLVWDPACGTGNLTRGLGLADLVLTSLEPGEVAAAAADHPGARCAAWDFLGASTGLTSLPAPAADRLRAGGRRLLFLANPPYGTAGNLKRGEAKKTAIAANPVGQLMRDELGLGGPAQQLYAQFAVRMATLGAELPFDSVAVAMFSKPSFLTARSFSAFRSWWYERMGFVGGFLFRADEFAQVSGDWGVSFTIWSAGAPTVPVDLQLKRRSAAGIATTGPKRLYDADGRRAYEWARGTQPPSQGDGVQLKGGLSVHHGGTGRRRDDALLWMVNDANDVYHSARTVWLQSGGRASSNHLGGFWLRADNVARGLTLFAARKAVAGSWVTDKDEFLAPCPEVEASPAFAAWQRDCFVFALSHPSNTCCAARALPYKDRTVALSNHLFWARPGEVVGWARAAGDAVLVDDARQAIAPWVTEPLSNPSAPAAEVLRLLRGLLQDTIGERAAYAEQNPGLHSHCWDAGLHQLKGLFASARPGAWAELRRARERLRVAVAAGVYEFGLLQ